MNLTMIRDLEFEEGFCNTEGFNNSVLRMIRPLEFEEVSV